MTPARLFLAAFALTCVLSGVALASDTHVWNAETFVKITPSDKPGVEAEVTFQNRDIHPPEAVVQENSAVTVLIYVEAVS